LDKLTRTDAASDFMGIHKVPKYAITMGIQTILGAKRIIIMAYSESKAGIVQRALEGEITPEIPATYL
jgi:glucosamine-6-phosphate deaminase